MSFQGSVNQLINTSTVAAYLGKEKLGQYSAGKPLSEKKLAEIDPEMYAKEVEPAEKAYESVRKDPNVSKDLKKTVKANLVSTQKQAYTMSLDAQRRQLEELEREGKLDQRLRDHAKAAAGVREFQNLVKSYGGAIDYGSKTT